jgi:glycosyltransferase involved in cell wall biosynthesis
MNKSASPFISVIICAFSMKRYSETVKCINSVLINEYKNFEMIIVIDGNEKLKQKIESEFKAINNILIVDNKKNEGPSVSRNRGVELAKGEIVAFIDDDAFAAPDWLETIVKNFYKDPEISALGGKLIPVYENGARKLPEELLWIVGCTYKGHPIKKQFVRNVISANMAVKREVFKEVQFEKMFDGRNWKMEDTLFGIRLFMKKKNAILYDPVMVVYHNVSKERTKMNYILQRSYSEGRLKYDLGRVIQTNFRDKQIFLHEQSYLKTLLSSIFRNSFSLQLKDCLLLSLSMLCVVFGYLTRYHLKEMPLR